MACIHLICGKICSGKSFYARALAREERAVILSCDGVMTLFPRLEGDAAYAQVSEKVKAYLLAQAVDIARCGAGVILDWGFWSKDEREKTGAFFADRQLPVQWHYLDISAERWEENIQKRNAAPGPSDYLVDEGLKQKCLANFQPPDSAEREGWRVVGS